MMTSVNTISTQWSVDVDSVQDHLRRLGLGCGIWTAGCPRGLGEVFCFVYFRARWVPLGCAVGVYGVSGTFVGLNTTNR